MDRYDSHAQSPGPAGRPGRRPLGLAARVALIVLAVMAAGAVLTVGAVAYAAHAVMTSPMVRVEVREHTGERMHLKLSIPGAAVSAGLTAAPWFLPDETWAEIEAEIQAELEAELDGVSADLRPVLGQLTRDLAALPDAVLVEVEDGGDHVRVVKQGSELQIRVRSPDADVDVDVPVELLERFAAIVEG